MWVLGKEFTFEASHQLKYHDGKCARLHGHSWKGIVYVQGNCLMQDGAKQGMVMDYSEIKQYLKPLVDGYLDHYHLNESLGLENPTSEVIAQWIFNQLTESGLRGLVGVQINETCTSRCFYVGTGDPIHIVGNAIIVG
jgi:6-pyruvoyltetrahydropterin/6-carboxytetrahydropterin synthase